MAQHRVAFILMICAVFALTVVVGPPSQAQAVTTGVANEPFNRTSVAQQWLYGFVLYFVSLPVLALEIYSIYNPEEAYLLFRRNLKYRGDVQLSQFYLDLTRYGSVFGLLMYSLLVILAGYGIVLLLALVSHPWHCFTGHGPRGRAPGHSRYLLPLSSRTQSWDMIECPVPFLRHMSMKSPALAASKLGGVFQCRRSLDGGWA